MDTRANIDMGGLSEYTRQYIRRLHETPAFGASGFDLAALRQCMSCRRRPADRAVRCVRADIGGMRGEWVVAPAAATDVRMLYLHGGGYVSGSGAYYLCLAAHISAMAGCAVYLSDYRLAPEHPFPAAVDDAVRAHEWVLGNGPDGRSEAAATFIAGDSAGGGLTLAALLCLRDRGLPLPLGGIALSPFTDMTCSGKSIQTEAAHDPIMSPRCLPEFVHLYLGDADPRDPLASPALGDYTGIPPLLIQVGEHEIIRDDSIMAGARAQDAGTEVTLEVWPGMFHVFQSHEPLLPEGERAVASIAAFVRRHTLEAEAR
jgi:acetyl esterase/lipase